MSKTQEIVRSLVEGVMDEARPSKQGRREKWMADFDSLVVKADSKHAGKIDWDTATFMFNRGDSPQDAATRYVGIKRKK